MAVLDIRVIPRAKRTCVDGMRGNAVLIRLAAAPTDGVANDTLIAFLAETIGLPRRAITILTGERSRLKRVQIDGIDLETAKARLIG